LALEDHDFLVEVERDFITDKFNLINLREMCGNPPPMSKSRFKDSLKLILSSKVPNEEDLQNAQFLELN
jgi:casein kinase II subunit beta